MAADGTVTPGPGSIAANTAISDTTVLQDETVIYNAIKAFIANATVTIPPSGSTAVGEFGAPPPTSA